MSWKRFGRIFWERSGGIWDDIVVCICRAGSPSAPLRVALFVKTMQNKISDILSGVEGRHLWDRKEKLQHDCGSKSLLKKGFV
jgi:hypothetical protein